MSSFLGWAFETGTEQVLVYVSVLDKAAVPTLRNALADLESPREVAVRGPEADDAADAPVQVSIGLGGREEFATAVQQIAEDAAGGELSPEAVDESEIERRLVFPTAPDLVIKTGAERLSDFLIWQSVYSELYFTDVNWRDFRKREFARAVREIAAAVEAGDLDPDDIAEADIEERLIFPEEPDLVIKTGAERLSDFLIWQSVYSELYFTDVNWRDFRRRDFLRAVREYQERQRRFGR